MQTYISGPDELRIVLEVRSWDNEHFFENITPQTLRGQTENTTISLGKGSSYLVYKVSSQPFLQIMPSCSNDAYFNKERMACVYCQGGMRSWSLQSTECIGCTRMWLSGGDDYTITIYR